MFAITGASGQLGRLVIEYLLTQVKASELIALVRDPRDVEDMALRGVQVRKIDYNQPATLLPALKGVKRLVLISSNELGRRLVQHQAVIDAAQQACIECLLYTSVTKASNTPILLAAEHRETELVLSQAKVPSIIVRNCWYLENLLQNLPMVLASGALYGAAKEGVIHAASRKDYAHAIANVLLNAEQYQDKVLELAADEGFTLDQYAEQVAQHSGQPIEYRNVDASQFQSRLQQLRMPQQQAELLADAQLHAASGWLQQDCQQLSEILNRPTQSMAQVVRAALS